MASFEDTLVYYGWGSRYLVLRSPVMCGTDVKVFQTLYNLFLQHSAPSPGSFATPIVADGIFGPETAQAVRAWQAYFGLPTDGVVGPVTGATLGQDPRAYGGPRFGSRGLVAGETGGDAQVLRNRLACYHYGRHFGAARGEFDQGVERAVAHFQLDMTVDATDPGVPDDGQVHYETFDALWVCTYVGGRNLALGRHGLDTLWIQRLLTAQGLFHDPLDGYFGPGMKSAVEDFQDHMGITKDGVVGATTMRRLGQVLNKPAGSWP